MFFSKKCDNAEVAHSRDRWRFCGVILRRRREQRIPPYARPFFIFNGTIFFVETIKTQKSQRYAHARTQQERVPEEGEIGRTQGLFYFLHTFYAAAMTAYPRDAVLATGP